MKITPAIVLLKFVQIQMILKRKKIETTHKSTIHRKPWIHIFVYKLLSLYLYIYLYFPKMASYCTLF